jgi:ribosomal protein S18 acetylase RimI-like enzyme
MSAIEYSDHGFKADAFVALANRVWPRQYDLAAAAAALTCTTNIGAWEGERLVGAVRVLTDGYFFATVPEILVDPDYQRRGIGRELMFRALAATPRGTLFLGAQPQSLGFSKDWDASQVRQEWSCGVQSQHDHRGAPSS